MPAHRGYRESEIERSICSVDDDEDIDDDSFHREQQQHQRTRGEESDFDDSTHFNNNSNNNDNNNDNKTSAGDNAKTFGYGTIGCFRIVIVIVLLASLIIAVASTWYWIEAEDDEELKQEIDDAILQVSLASEQMVHSSMDWIQSMGDSMATSSTASLTNLNFASLASHVIHNTPAQLLLTAPIIQDIASWNNYTAYNHQQWMERGWQRQQIPLSNPPYIDTGMFQLDTNTGETKTVPPQTTAVQQHLPIWQMEPVPTQQPNAVNFDLLSDPVFADLFQELQQRDSMPILSGLVRTRALVGDSNNNNNSGPSSLVLQPIHDDTATNMVAILLVVLSWDDIMSRIVLPEISAATELSLDIVVQSTCGDTFTYQIQQQQPTYLGKGNLATNNGREHILSKVFNASALHPVCDYDWYIYPKSATEESEHNRELIIGIEIAFFIITLCLFCCYDRMVHQRQRQILASAHKSEEILAILYPKTVRDRLFGDTGTTKKSRGFFGKFGAAAAAAAAAAADNIASNNSNDDDEAVGKKYKELKTYLNGNNENSRHKRSVANWVGGNQNARSMESAGDMDTFGSKPIADLFSNTTVLFSDIAGFTAWSSVREPSQVFTLLETVYRAFDNISKRRRVFKVETVGDCYVAVTGLPDPRKDHAVAMARFARECLKKFNNLVSLLETTLGPDTGDLALRTGLHSGPVTAGVLRGDKSRFQLFGDTVNTAARIESTGRRNRIHISTETAQLLIDDGRGAWVKKRGTVVAKGKGVLETFWLLVREETASTFEEDTPEDDDMKSEAGEEAQNTMKMDMSEVSSTQPDSTDELPMRTKRLVQWNFDVMSRLLKQIVAKRNAELAQSRLSINNHISIDNYELNSMEKDLMEKQMVLEEVAEVITLPHFDAKIHRRQQPIDEVQLPPEVDGQLYDYVARIANMYPDNSFHNFDHASHVMMSVNKLLSRIVAADEVNDEAAIHDHTYGITSDPLTQFAVLLAALIHDVQHQGVSNMQLIKENDDIAEKFDNKSVAEQNSICVAWSVLMEPQFKSLRRCIYSEPSDLKRLRALLVNSVLATDIFDGELQALRKGRWEKAFSSAAVAENENDVEQSNRKATIVIEHLIQASDVSHTMQHWHIYCKWNERLFAEMTVAYQAGRLDKNPGDNWYQGELWFFDNYIIPLAKKLKECGVFGVSSDEYLNYALDNRREWENKGQDVVQKLINRHQANYTSDEDDQFAGEGTTQNMIDHSGSGRTAFSNDSSC